MIRYRALEYHFTLYLSLYKPYIEALMESNPIIEKDVREGLVNAMSNIQNYRQESKES